MTETLKEFYLAGGQVEDGSSSAPPAGYEPAREPEGPTLAHRAIDAGKQYEERLQSHLELETLLAQTQHGDKSAFYEIIQRFAQDPAEIKVTITQPLRDSHGKEPEQFGMRVIENERELDAFMQDYAVVAGYFPDIEVSVVPTTTKGKRLAVVMGISARNFNALVAAVRHKSRLERELDGLDRQIRKSRKELDVENTPVDSMGKDEKPQPGAPAQGSSGGKGGKADAGGKGGKGGGKGI